MASRSSSETLQPHDPEKDMLLAGSEDYNVSSIPLASKRSSSMLRLLVAWLGILSFISGSLVIYILFPHHSHASEYASVSGMTPSSSSHLDSASSSLSCGSTISEALSRGCVFDVMSFLWVPTPCYDAELTNEFLAARDWHFYSKYHGNSTNGELTIDQVKSGEYDAFVPWEYHLVHCTFQWRKMHRALAKQGPLDSYLANYNHTLHCEEMLWRGEWHGREVVNTKISRQYVSCGYHEL